MGKVMATFSLLIKEPPPPARCFKPYSHHFQTELGWPSTLAKSLYCWVPSWPSGGRLVGRDPQHHTNPAPAVDQVRHQVPGGELSDGPYLQGACSGRSQQWELPRLSPFWQHPGYTSCGGTNPKSDGFVHMPAILPLTLQPPASLASLSS